MIQIKVDNVKVLVKKDTVLLQVFDYIGLNVPRFCYHKRLLVAGNCRICLVEIKGYPKPTASCAIPVQDGIVIFTSSAMVKKARESVIEFLLLNHPLDCPICDQGGECDLQNQSIVFGSDSSRFFDKKRSVEDKFCGNLIKIVMTRCIQCTRCVRYSSEIIGESSLGLVGRGVSIEISQYVNKLYKGHFSGNVIDLCPVGFIVSSNFLNK